MSIHGESLSKGSGRLRLLQDEQRADHLRPRGPALRRRSDDDVTGAKLKAVPAVAVVDSPLIAAHGRHSRSGSDPVSPRSSTAHIPGESHAPDASTGTSTPTLTEIFLLGADR